MRSVDELMIVIHDLAASRKVATTNRRVPDDTLHPLFFASIECASRAGTASHSAAFDREQPRRVEPGITSRSADPEQPVNSPYLSKLLKTPRSLADFAMPDDWDFLREAYAYLLNREP